MKVCQICHSQYQDDLAFCLDDGSVLVDLTEWQSEGTLILPENKIAYSNTIPNRQATAGQNQITNADNQRKTSNKFLWLVIISILLSIPILSIAGGFYYLRGITKSDNAAVTKTPLPLSKEKAKPEIKVEVQNKVKGSFGKEYLRCLVTNISPKTVETSRITLSIYNNDVKGDSVWGETKVDLLKPNQSIPVWVDVTNKKFTRAEYEGAMPLKISEKDESELFPKLIYTDVKMTNQTLTSMYNFRSYPEVFYKVKGIVVNNDYDNVKPKIYIFFYDENRQIVGISSAYPPNLKRNEKAEFEVQIGETQIFGKPKDFEVFAISK